MIKAGGQVEDKHLRIELQKAIQDELGQCGYPAMPQNFPVRVSHVVSELVSEVRQRLISQSDAFKEARHFAKMEYHNIYSGAD